MAEEGGTAAGGGAAAPHQAHGSTGQEAPCVGPHLHRLASF